VATSFFRGINPLTAAYEADLVDFNEELAEMNIPTIDPQLENRNRNVLSFMVGPSLAWRLADGPGQASDTRVVLGVEGGVNTNVFTRVCSQYETESDAQSLSSLKCSLSDTGPNPIGAIGGHLAFQWNFLTIGLFTNYGVGDNTFTGAIMTGLVFDP
jgi:hypothetical protein